MNNYTDDFVLCNCSSEEHCVFIRYFKHVSDREPAELYFSIHLNSWLPWYRKVWQAIKYVFGYRCKYGDFDEILLNKESATKLRDICERYLGDIKDD